MSQQINFGVLENLLQNRDITEIMVNGHTSIYVEAHGKLQATELQFESESALMEMIQAVAEAYGRSVDETAPLLNLRLDDGSIFNVVLPPASLDGALVTIRKVVQQEHSWDALIGFGSLNAAMRELLQAIVANKLNVVVAGGSSSGKTTIINALSEFIPHDQRIVAIEGVSELRLRHPHVVRLLPSGPDSNGRGGVSMSDLFINATMMRADRLMLAEVRGSDAWNMLTAMSSGYDGSIFGIHATSVSDCLERIEMMATGATNFPLLQIRAKMAQSIQVVVQQLRLSDGKRRIVSIAEVTGLKNNVVESQEIVRFDGKDFQFTGYVPSFAEKIGLGAAFFKG